MGNLNNLTPKFQNLDKEKMRKIAQKGGIASQKKQRENKLLREQLSLLLSLPIKDKDVKKELKKFGLTSEEATNQMALTLALYQEALTGNVKAYETIRDTIGQKPVDKVEVKEVETDWFIEE